MRAEDNQFPYLTVAEASAPAVLPPSGCHRIFVDVADGLFKTVDSAGTVAPLKGADGAPGPAGATGATGPAGPTGATGPGVPAGGAAGLGLVKASGADYDTKWQAYPYVLLASTGTAADVPAGTPVGALIVKKKV